MPVEVRREDIYLCEIPDDVELASPVPRALALDPARGRLAFPAGLDVQEVWVQSSYGFSGDLGGGPYDRERGGACGEPGDRARGVRAATAGGFLNTDVWQARRLAPAAPDDGSGTLFASLRQAVAAWNLQPPGRDRRDRADGQPYRRCRSAGGRSRSRSRSPSARGC